MRTIVLGTAWAWLALTAAWVRAGDVLSPAMVAGLPEFVVSTWKMQDGLPSERVRAVLQTHDRYLWVATFNGAARFDGVQFRVFNKANTPALRNNAVSCLFEDADARLWFGSDQGEITWRDGGGFHALEVTNAWPSSSIRRFAQSADGALWVLNSEGFILFVPKVGGQKVLGGRTGPLYSDVVMDTERRAWAVRYGGALARLAEGQATPADPDLPPPVGYSNVAAARRGGLWVREGERLRRWQAGEWVEDRGYHPWGTNQSVVLFEAAAGDVWVGTREAGAFVVAAGSSEHRINRESGLPHNFVSSVGEDHEGNIWIGSNGGGLALARRRALFMIGPPDQWQHRAVLSVSPALEGGLWVGTEGAGLYKLQDGEFTRYSTTAKPAATDIRAAAEDRQGGLWVCSEVRERLTSGLLVQEAPGKFAVGTDSSALLRLGQDGQLRPVTHVDTKMEMPAFFYALYQSRAGEMLMGSQNGVLSFAQDRWSRLGAQLSRPDVRCIAESPDGTLWFGMFGGGLASYRDGKCEQFGRAEGLGDENVSALLGDMDGSVWIGTPGKGLVRRCNGRFDRFTTREGLPSDFICNIQADQIGHLWVGSYGGVFRVAKSELDRCARSETASVNCLVLDASNGLTSMEMASGNQPSACATRDGRMWFATTRGLAMLDVTRIRTNTLPPAVLLEEVVLGDHPLPPTPPAEAGARPAAGQVFRVPAGAGQVELRYTALSYCAPARVRFRYRLETLDPEWVEAGNRRSAAYSHLPPREYRFQVIACNNDGVWNGQGAAALLVVLPHFWQTWWFAPLCWLGGVCMAGTAVLARLRRRHRARLEALERVQMVERERGRIARDLHDDLGGGLTDISTTSAICQNPSVPPEETREYLREISQRANEMVAALDEIVWAVNPKHDNLGSLAFYFSQFAERFVRGTPIRCRFDVQEQLPQLPLNAEQRHSLFLAFKEALQNTVKHAGASSLRVSIAAEDGLLRIALEDDGRGFAPGPPKAGADGLQNMRERLQQLGGRCDIVSAPGKGARVTFEVPVARTRGASA